MKYFLENGTCIFWNGVTMNNEEPRLVITYERNVELLSITSSCYLMSLHVNIFYGIRFEGSQQEIKK